MPSKAKGPKLVSDIFIGTLDCAPCCCAKQGKVSMACTGMHAELVLKLFHNPAGDFPDVVRYREILSAYDITQFPKLKDSMLKAIEDSLSVDIPSLVRQFDNPYA